MKPSLSLFVLMQLVFLLSLFHFTVANFSSSMLPLCHGDERSALLQIKESFIIKNSASADPSAYPKVASWTPEGESSNCCSWDGIECDEDTGHVISLDLTSSCLYGSITSSTSLFCLVHLEWLSLADNDFNYSEIPSWFGNLSRLSYLDLSSSAFSGQIPSEILELSKLVSLDLRDNSLKLQKPGLKSLAEKLINLKELGLSGVNISSTIPHILANMSSLTSLLLRECGLHGEFPTRIFQLPNLQSLSVRFNPHLTGFLPEFLRGSPLKDLRLTGTSFSGELPNSIGNIKSLNNLDFHDCYFSGQIPSSLANLTKLDNLDLSSNNFSGSIPSSLENLNKLSSLDFSYNKLSGEVDFDLFSKLKNLTKLQLSNNYLSVNIKPSINVTLPKFQILGLSSCNLNEFPVFLQNQDKMEFLELSDNKIHGQIPKWFWNLSKKTLLFLNLGFNFLTCFDQPPIVLPWTSLRILDLSNNNLRGSLPIPPPSIFIYDISNNKLTGEISPFFCNLTSVIELNLSNNSLGGMPPQCLGNLGNSLLVLDLRNNNFHGNIPQTYMKGCKLRMIDLSENQLQGKVPRSLANCTMLETLHLGNNQMNDTFPSWLSTLQRLKVLILRSNEFHSAIEDPITKFAFPMLRIIDISHNSFTGKLPPQHFQMWNAMKNFDAHRLMYLEANTSFEIPQYSWSLYFDFSMVITNKGTETYYEKIQEFLVAIDLSSNKFEGEIAEVIGDLKALRLLNLSNNLLTGHIPSSFGNLTELESLDLSQNKLFGEIPRQLSNLTFLAFLNVSYNRLTGPIPQGKQFDTFQNNSFEGNPGLCGVSLSKKCGTSEALPPPPSSLDEDEGSDSLFEFDWKIVLMGYGSGLVIGIVIGHTVINRKLEWFVKTFVAWQLKRKDRRRGDRN